ncbi:VOC family protein [Streptomyces sp. NPDC056938]|uniref:VOC family protein n=1 Tax=unclassified Streptomyces TaxID=2593676 RepID=UPI00362D7A1F
MAARPEGAPIWADAMFPDLEAAKRFYGELLGWTFEEGREEFGNYTQAKSDGKRVGALSPQMPGMEGTPPSWNLYLATPDVKATAARVKESGGTLLMEPMEVGDFGSMVSVQDPAGVFFSLWQPGTHDGFEKVGEPGSYAWAEVTTRDTGKTDGFFEAAFPYEVRKMADENVDFNIWQLDGQPQLGRFKMTEDFPPQVPSYVNVYFAVDDCDAAVATVTRLGGKLHYGPMDTPFGRFAAVTDPQGAAFSVIDLSTTQGEMPDLT